MKKLLEFFEEDNGRLSNMRFMATALVLNALFIATYSVIAGKLDVAVIGLVTSLISFGIGGKLVQKVTEVGADGTK